MTTNTDIYKQLKSADVELSSHESDLYALKDTTSESIIADYKFKSSVTIFRNQRDNKLWYDIPFAYTPYWENKSK